MDADSLESTRDDSIESDERRGWGMLPLAPLCDDAAANLPALIDRITQRLAHEHPDRTEAKSLAVITDILLGLRYDRAMTQLMMEKMMSTLDVGQSHGYQLILEKGEAKGLAKGLAEGRADGIRETILHVGAKKFGDPSAAVLAELKAITDEGRLTALSERILEVESWAELLRTKI